jgi:hypothetical protein
MSDLLAMAIDVGSGMTKVVTGDRRAAFPSVGGPPIAGGHRMAEDPYSEVEFGTTHLTVGERAYADVKPEDLPETNTPEWFRSDVYLALMYSGLARMLPPEFSGRVALCTGLPIAYYNATREALAERLTGEHKFKVGGVSYRVVIRRPNLYIVPQVLGLYFWALDHLPGVGARKAGFIDVGTFTTGWAMVERLDVLQWATGGAPIGVSMVREALREHLELVYDWAPDRAGLEVALRTGEVHVGNSPERVSDFLRDAARQTGEPLRRELRDSWGLAKDAAIYVGGGGARLFYPSICAVYPHAQCLAIDDPIFTVAAGYARWMEHRLRLKQSVA